ncbi:hypothetical protein PR048_011804 [Dryococelus australis]|uniref:DDE-1 domain-containing protein n=1 Tax=Dryococelus australis TaxID=614101 RepID=A0ABQ9HNC7_9NEOP|nr:hypothetical protein PR048_011804 [Dryococelus australis]
MHNGYGLLVILHSKLKNHTKLSASDGWLTQSKRSHVHVEKNYPLIQQQLMSGKTKDLIEKEVTKAPSNLKWKCFTGSHKLPLLVIGESQKPRVFNNVNVSSLPVCYKSRKSAWIVLVLYDVSTHPQGAECVGHPRIECFFLPPHVNSTIQPMDQGVIECLKKHYRRKLLSEILIKMKLESKGLIEVLKSININDVIYMVAKFYEEIPSSIFIKSWRKAWPVIEKSG